MHTNFYIMIFLCFFSLSFLICLFCLLKKERVKENLYLIIPAICIGLCALSYVVQMDFILFSLDFKTFYQSGKQIFKNPTKLYKNRGYLYMPSFALLFAISISLLPFTIASYIFLIINYVFAVLVILEYDKILILMNLKQKIHRFMFLMIISNGYFVYCQFLWNQTKYLLFFILVFIIRRELKYIKNEKEKDLKFYIINYGLFVFFIGIAPYFIFLFLIYIFQDIKFNQIFKKQNIKKYVLVALLFIAQNFLFFIYPSLIFDYLNGFNLPQRNRKAYFLFYLREWIQVSGYTMVLLTIISTIILFFYSLILIYCNKLKIEQKFSYFALAYIFIGVFSFSDVLLLMLFSFVLLLFVPFLIQNAKGIEFFKSNAVLLTGLFSIVVIFFISHRFIIYESFPELKVGFFVVFDKLRWIFFLSIMMISLIFLHSNKERL